MTQRNVRRVMSNVLIFLSGSVTIFVVTMLVLALTRKPSVSIVSVQPDSVMLSSGSIEIAVHINRREFCESDTDRNLWRYEWRNLRDLRKTMAEADVAALPRFGYEGSVALVRRVMPLIKRSMPLSGIGDNVYFVDIPTPPETDPGEWHYVSRTRYRCPLLPHGWLGYIFYSVEELQSPDVRLHVRGPGPPITQY